MTSQERIKTAINHKETSILPIDFGGMRSTGIQAIAYNKLLDYLGVKNEKSMVYDIFQQLAEPSKNILDKMNGDVIQLHRLCPSFGIDIKNWKPDSLPDGSPAMVPIGYNPEKNERGGLDIMADGLVIATRPEGGIYFDQVIHPYENAISTADVNSVELPPLTEEELDFLFKQASKKRYESDRAILFAFGGNILEAGQLDFGYENFYMKLALEPKLMHYYFARLAEYYIESLDSIMPLIADKIDIIQFGDDLGTQVALQISVEMYREMIKPYHKKIYRYVRDNWPDVSVFMHSCGAIYDLVPDLIDNGVQILNPVQISAVGMDPLKLKNEFGRDIVFWGGGADMQRTVVSGSINQIRDEVRRLIDIFSKDGGYVFTQVHNIQADVPPEKVVAIYETAAEYR